MWGAPRQRVRRRNSYCFVNSLLSLKMESLPFILAIFFQDVPEQPAWTSLETTKIIVSILMPVSVVTFGWLLNRRLKHIEHRQWANQKLIERRLELYDDIAPELNKLLCFYIFVGSWKRISPDEALETKRALDQKVHIYRYLLGDAFFKEYTQFINILFKQWQGHGVSASFRAKITSDDRGSRIDDNQYDNGKKLEWKSEWGARFVENEALPYKDIEKGYERVMNALKDTIEIYG